MDHHMPTTCPPHAHRMPTACPPHATACRRMPPHAHLMPPHAHLMPPHGHLMPPHGWRPPWARWRCLSWSYSASPPMRPASRPETRPETHADAPPLRPALWQRVATSRCGRCSPRASPTSSLPSAPTRTRSSWTPTASRCAPPSPPSCVDSQHRTRQPAHHAPLPAHHPTHTARRTRKLRPTPLRPTPIPGPHRLGGQPVRSDDPHRRPLRPASLPAHRGLQAGRVHGALTLTPTMTLTLTTDPVH